MHRVIVNERFDYRCENRPELYGYTERKTTSVEIVCGDKPNELIFYGKEQKVSKEVHDNLHRKRERYYITTVLDTYIPSPITDDCINPPTIKTFGTNDLNIPNKHIVGVRGRYYQFEGEDLGETNNALSPNYVPHIKVMVDEGRL